MFRSAVESAGSHFSVECLPIAEPVYVDRDMWQKVVSSLLSNALKFTFAGAVKVTLKSVERPQLLSQEIRARFSLRAKGAA